MRNSVGWPPSAFIFLAAWCSSASCVFGQSYDRVEIEEATSIGSTVHAFPAPAIGEEYSIYQYGDSESLGMFDVNAKGEVSTKRQLSYVIRESNSYYVTAVKRIKGSSSGGVAYTRKLEILDNNNHPPRFAKAIYYGFISEGMPAGTTVLGLDDCFATDLDESGISDYTITEGNNNNQFQIQVRDVNGIKLLVVKSTGTLDRDDIRSAPHIDLGVRANDGGTGDNQKFAKTVIRISILDINDNPPVFVYNKWQRSIQENAALLTSVMKVSASDNDGGRNAELYYYFEEITDDLYIHPATGLIYVARRLNYDLVKSYSLTVVAQDKSPSSPRFASASVKVDVLNVQNYPADVSKKPLLTKQLRFLETSFSVTIRADLPQKAFVFIAIAYYDNIQEERGSLTYSLSGSGSNIFRISPGSGIITLAGRLDRLSPTTYDLTITVRDAPGLSVTAPIKINVQPLNLNLNQPVFNPSTVSINTKGDVQVNGEIGYSVRAIDLDPGDDGRLTYLITGGTGMGLFHVNSETGVITSKRTFTKSSTYDLYIEATDSGEYKSSGRMYLQVNVQLPNQMEPVLAQPMCYGVISENEMPNSFVAAVFAKSPIPGADVVYRVVSGSRSHGLALDERTGVITTTQELDYERERKKYLEVEAYIVGTSLVSRTLVEVNVLNINDNPPVFTRSSITVHVRENSGEIPSLVCLFADDPDGIDSNVLSYAIKSGNVGNKFSIDSNTGQLSVQNLDYELHSSYKLTVEASDSKNTATAVVDVIVIDSTDPPTFEKSLHSATVAEHEKAGVAVATLEVTSQASGSHACAWGFDVTPEILSLFVVSAESKACVVSVAGGGKISWRADRPFFKFSIRAINLKNTNEESIATLTVSIQDVNDHAPELAQDSYAVSIIGDLQLEKPVLKIAAVDLDDGANGRISFDIQGGADSNRFYVSPSGELSIQSLLEINKQYVLTVNAKDQAVNDKKSSACQVLVTVHDKSASIPKITNAGSAFAVSESAGLNGNVFSVVAIGSNLEYSIVGGNKGEKFMISSSGQVTLQGQLDYEERNTYTVVVRVAARGTTPTAYSEGSFLVNVIDENDNAPTFAIMDASLIITLSVDQHSPKGTVISKYRAYDKDSGENGVIAYSILGSGAPLTVDQNGVVTASRDMVDPVGTEFKFRLQATDKGSPSKSSELQMTLKIKSGVKPPSFSQAMFRATIEDNAGIGTNVLEVSTTDTDPMSTSIFKILSGDPNNVFCIDSSRMMYVQRPLDRDFIADPKFLLSVELVYGYQSSIASLIVDFEDQNDNAPTFKKGAGVARVKISEAAALNTVIFTASASDADDGTNGKITYSISHVVDRLNSAGRFSIDAATGEVRIAQSLNFEAAQQHVIIIKAEDQSVTERKYALMELLVEVEDVNDERPTFSNANYVAYVSSNAKAGSQILTVFAADFDSGVLGQVEYEIAGTDYDGTFEIGRTTGTISLLKPVALRNENPFKLTLKAQDRGSPSLGGQAIVTIYTVIEEGPPVFALSKFTFNVTENNNENVFIGIAKAISLDSLVYAIQDGNIGGAFSIDASTGRMYAVKKLDAEVAVKYALFIRATDLGARFAEASVDVNVINVNDNGPLFRDAVGGLVEVVVARDLAVGMEVVDVHGYDLDVGDKLTFKIITSEAWRWFQIDALGVVRSLDSLTKLPVINEFDVRATDKGGLQSTVKIRVILANFRPGYTEVIRSVDELRLPAEGWFIKDSNRIPPFYPEGSFKIVWPSVNPFTIDEAYGYVGLSQQVDYETRTEYTFIIQETRKGSSDYVNYKVRVKVIDANDNRPRFTMTDFFAKVNKNALPGTKVYRLSAIDPDSGASGEVVFEIVTQLTPFSIDPLTSEITTSAYQLTEEWYNISVRALDKGSPALSSDDLTIFIMTGSNPPVFLSDLYQFNVKENSQTGIIVGTVQARSLSGIGVAYSIQSGNVDNNFVIDSSGRILLQGNLDYESGRPAYSLLIKAEEISENPLFTTVNAIITIENMNDNPPEFTHAEYRSPDISETDTLGKVLLTVSATDCDCSQSCKCAGGLLTYSLEKYTNIFKIDAVTGEIRNIAPLDYDVIKEFRFVVKVTDTGEPRQSGVADVIIMLANVNDNVPIFEPNFASVAIAESIREGTVVLTVQAQDGDGDVLTYAIEPGSSGASNFEIGSSSGVLRINTKGNPVFFDYTYVLNISASDGRNKGYFKLTVNVDDINDNSPSFKSCDAYKATVLENEPIGSFVIQVSAKDADRGRNGEVEYSLQEPQKGSNQRVLATESDFRIDNATGIITTNKIFDREEKNRYIVLVIAQDGGYGRSAAERNSGSCQLEITIGDINDHSPVFSVPRYDISIAGDTPLDAVVLEVSAQDRDEGKNAEIAYSVKQAHLTPQFTINPKSGAISVAQSLVGQQSNYRFRVTASDAGTPRGTSDIEVSIYVMPSHPPKFSQISYKVRIKENLEVGSDIIKVTATSQRSEGKTSRIFYSVLPGNLPSTNKPPTFTVNSDEGIIRLARVLDYESLKEYVLEVQAMEEGMKSNAKVFISVDDVNDNSPLFVLREYQFGKVAEGKRPGQPVETVNATDADSGLAGVVRYSLVASKEAEMFSINSVTGEITTNAVFDREVTPSVTFSVKAQDQAVGEKRLEDIVYVKIVITDVNDNGPVFAESRYEKEIEESAKIDSTVLIIEALDADAGDHAMLYYYIVSGNDKGYFSTNSVLRADGRSLGFVTVAKKLDREDEDKFTLKIAASDSLFNAFTFVYITVKDVNDNDPVFQPSIYNSSIREDALAGVLVLSVTATDLDTPQVQQPITYSLAPETSGYFEIDKTSGAIMTGNKGFDREIKPVFTFMVYASDGVRTGSATVRIVILDVNDEKPYFPDFPYLRYVKENQKRNHEVGLVTAKDNDEGLNSKITYSLSANAGGLFTIDVNTGMILTTDTLDRESNKNKFVVTVVATDKGNPPMSGSVDCTIIVTDDNDQYPTFVKNLIETKILECANIGDVVTQVQATDADEGVNAELLYSISSGNTPRRFRIDPITGTITVAHRLDYEKEQSYKLSIGVRDKGIPQLRADKNATVVITMEDCNDNPPQFDKPSYTVDVYENATVGSLLEKVSAFDPDTGANGEFMFGIEDADENYQFTIAAVVGDWRVGEVRTAWSLDRERRNKHVLRLSATDKGDPPLTGYAQLFVNVLDVNDNGPEFIPPEPCGFVEEERIGVQVVANLRVIDKDGPGNQCPCTFEITKVAGLGAGVFTIEAQSGGSYAIVKTTASAKFDREAKIDYTLTVVATDSGSPPMSTTTHVHVEVGDIDDNPPMDDGKLTITLNSYKGEFKGGKVGSVYIRDNDLGEGSLYTHTLVSPAGKSFFTVDGSSGAISALPGVPAGVYELEFRSKEVKATGATVSSKVTVNVREISEKAAKSGVPLRMTGYRLPHTCQKIAYPEFEATIAKIMEVKVEDVVLYSAMEVPGLHMGVDIWFSVIKRKPGFSNAGDDLEYVDAKLLIGMLSAHKEFIETETRGKVMSIGINVCAPEPCTVGFCYQDIQPQRTYSVVTDDNGIVPASSESRTFVSMDMVVVPVCEAGPRIPDGCKPNPCRHGGTCLPILPSGFRCLCHPGFDGPYCQVTTRHVKPGGWFWLNSISYFFEGKLTFQFSSKVRDGLLFYQGPISKLSPLDVRDFIAVELVQGHLRLSITQGEEKIFVRTLTSTTVLDDDRFHRVAIYKRGKYIQLILDNCENSEVSEVWGGVSVQNRTNCEVSGTIPGLFRFMKGNYPLQVGGVRYKTLEYPELETVRSKKYFHGCIRNVIDNGVMFDLAYPLAEQDTDSKCNPIEAYCPACVFGTCDTTRKPFVCVCAYGWIGLRCDERAPAYLYAKYSFTRYWFTTTSQSRRTLTWYENLITHYQVQVRTRSDGIIIWESSSRARHDRLEFSVLEIVKGVLRYRYNLGDGVLNLDLPGVNITDNQWHNISVYRYGAFVTFEVVNEGYVTGSMGTHQLLQSDGYVYVGGIPEPHSEKHETVIQDFQGCIAHLRIRGIVMDRDELVMKDRYNVNKSCPCLVAGGTVCLNGGICMAGSPPWCICPPGWLGPNCAVVPGQPLVAAAAMGFNGLIIIIILLLVFLLSLVFIALFMAGVFKKKRAIPIYVDAAGTNNIMPYHDEGAGEDDFHNYDLEQLLKHAGGRGLMTVDGGTAAGGMLAGGAAAAGSSARGLAGGMGASGISAGGMSSMSMFSKSSTSKGGVSALAMEGRGERERLLVAEEAARKEDAALTNSEYSSQLTEQQRRQTTTLISEHHQQQQQQQRSSANFTSRRSQAESIDVVRFIETKLTIADSEEAAFPRDTLLHYGYEGAGSDVDDLSELDGSDEEVSEDEDDFTFMQTWGPKFDALNKIFNPEPSDIDEDV